MAERKLLADSTFTLSDFLWLFLLDPDGSITFVREPNEYRPLASRVRLERTDAGVGVKIEVAK